MEYSIEHVEHAIQPLREKLKNHKLYTALSHIDDIKTFMEQHVFAVWDFMSLLKALQHHLTCTTLPWFPVPQAATARFINEIVLGEESDLDANGIPKSHFEMYLDAMSQLGASTETIHNFLEDLKAGISLDEALKAASIPAETSAFVTFSFEIINTQAPHKIASAFTFGREDVIPDMFFEIIKQSNTSEEACSKLVYYLNRHIELDGDEHGPLSLKMIAELCGDDKKKWEEVLEVAELALQKRIALWDGITKKIQERSLTTELC